ncbi:unnamed protein product [Acanthoscelides obtectus]|uniref:Uncharacterized protein n=1 Tax=Acanthoscelides obtectus TaxID=200917 RepID=A0A9P0K3N0_ACAOB|nr:unnamed protein product [Acanthoscelides obtectus]CAK1658263.1 hypothetical protein AOBTE_LOCUS20790 [Acanthoscelides obtectus]
MHYLFYGLNYVVRLQFKVGGDVNSFKIISNVIGKKLGVMLQKLIK